MSRFGGGGGFGNKFGGAAPAAQQQQQQQQSFEASDFGGAADAQGGFQGTQDVSPGRSPKRGGAIVQTLTPVTVRQLLLAKLSGSEDVFKVDDRELNQITMVGQIVHIQTQSTNIELDVDDGTGKIGVRLWTDLPDDHQTQLTVGTYVRVIGNLRSFMDIRSILAFRVLPLEPGKLDELTYHLLDAIHVHLSVTRGDLDDDAPTAVTSNHHYSSSHSGAPSAGGHHRAAAPGRFTYCQNSVLDVFRAVSRQHSDGCSIGEVIEALGTQFSEDEIRNSIDFLSAEGHLYSTKNDFLRCAE